MTAAMKAKIESVEEIRYSRTRTLFIEADELERFLIETFREEGEQASLDFDTSSQGFFRGVNITLKQSRVLENPDPTGVPEAK